MDYTKYDKYQNEREKKVENKPEEKPEALSLPMDILDILDWEDKTELEHLPLGKQSEFLIKYQFAGELLLTEVRSFYLRLAPV